MQQKYTRWLVYLIVLSILLLITILHSLSSGELQLSLWQIPEIINMPEGSMEQAILFNIRLPRIVLGFAVGGALSLAGVILQGVFRNPLVEPYTLGISGGAALGVALTIVLGLHLQWGLYVLPTAGFFGAMCTIVAVYILSFSRGRIQVQQMLLVGVMISFVASSSMMFLMATTNTENLHGIVFWIMGSLDETSSELIATILVLSVAGLIISIFFSQTLNALRLGEEKARFLGVNTGTAIQILFFVSSILTGVAVSIAGVIGFVGLIVPHLMRLFVGLDYRILLPSCFLGGSAFVIFSDTIARTVISPNELPIGVITGMVGGLVFIVVLSRFSKKGMS